MIAVFGVRGIGTLYYVAYALQEGSFAVEDERIWAVAWLVVTASVLFRGVSATPVTRYLDKERRVVDKKVTGDPKNAPTTTV